MISPIINRNLLSLGDEPIDSCPDDCLFGDLEGVSDGMLLPEISIDQPFEIL